MPVNSATLLIGEEAGTTTFTGTTELVALDALARLPGAEVRVSYDTRRTRLHAKAWLFQRSSGLDTAYIGSANLTHTALTGGHEWTMKAAAGDLSAVLAKFAGTFATLWDDVEFEPYHPDDPAHRARLGAALSSEVAGAPTPLTLLALRPLPFQERILDKLEAERAVHQRRRNLVVAATGTGKTVIAALDYARIAARAGARPRLLFLAHRTDLVRQARDTFRHALCDAAFGELSTDGERATRLDHVFATVQSALSGKLLDRVGAAHFRHVIVDECHHLPAASYRSLVTALAPELLVGLTATPERADGRDLLPDFDGHVAAELRLWDALDDQLLVPFEYYGISDRVDLRAVRWTRTGYDAAALAQVYTGHQARAALVLAQLARHVGDVRRVRGLGFCVSVEHARYMAERFCAAGVPSLALSADSSDDERTAARRALEARELNMIFTCDLYNEGVDLPFVDTLLLLRPTSSATLFLQQLGRGLRHCRGKATCLVLDFIGQHRDEFRFDRALAAMTGIPRARLRVAIEEGFPFLPSGCAVQLDHVAREQVLRSLRGAVATAARLRQELRELSEGGPPTLGDFLRQTGRELDDVYHAGGWSTLKAGAGHLPADAARDDLSRRLGWLTHVDEPARLRTYSRALAELRAGQAMRLGELDRARVLMLEYQLHPRDELRTAEAALSHLAAAPGIVDEFEELREVLEDQVELPLERYPVADWPLALHRHYSRREILAAVGRAAEGTRVGLPQGGVLGLGDGRELLFVTLDKSGGEFSPSTRYRDYAISPDRFHWETQAVASVSRPSGQRYLDSPDNGWSFYLFVRTDTAAAYAFLGAATYESHTGDRPIAITWRLSVPMPAALCERYATLRPT